MRFSAFVIIFLFLGCKQSSKGKDFSNQSNEQALSQVTTSTPPESVTRGSQGILTPTPEEELFLVESIKEDGIISLVQDDGLGLARVVLAPVPIKVATPDPTRFTTTDPARVQTPKPGYMEVEYIKGLKSLRHTFANHPTNFQIPFERMEASALKERLKNKDLPIPRENILCQFKAEEDAMTYKSQLERDLEIDSSIKITMFKVDSTTSPKSYIFKIRKVLTDQVASDFFEKKGFKLDPSGRIFSRYELSALFPGYLAENPMRISPAKGLDFVKFQREFGNVEKLLF